jgi:hypothetical protein
MDRELEEQIDELIHKATKDLKTRIIRIVVRNQNKLLKEQAREFKSTGSSAHRKDAVSSSHRKDVVSSGGKGKASSKKESKYHSHSDSDSYYSD